MNIRPYREQDWPRLCEIHDRARRDELHAASLADAFVPLVVAAEREELFGYELQVAELDGVVVGFVAYSEDEIAWLYVDPGCYRRGVGKALVAAARQAMRGPISVEVLKGNRPALQMYQACGFVEVATRHGRMPGNEAYAVTVHVLEHDALPGLLLPV